MRVAVAGGSGFLGTHLVAALRAEGHRVLVLARGRRPAPAGEGVEFVAADAGAGELPLDRLRGCDALVNLVGIKWERGGQTFERAHVEAVGHLLAAAREAGIRRFIHVSVVASRPDPKHLYHDTKWRGEQLVRESELAWTILRPGVIYGPGDDMLTHLIKLIRFWPLFPIVGRGEAVLQPVHALDVAEAVLATLESEAAVGKSYDVVSPTRLTLRQVVRITARGVGLPLVIFPTPVWLMRGAVRLMNLLPRPLSTPAQLQMLVDGMHGDASSLRRELRVAPEPFTEDAAREVERAVPSLFGFSLRTLSRRRDVRWLRGCGERLPEATQWLVAAVAVVLLLSVAVENVWYRMALAYAVLIPVVLLRLKLGWRELLLPRPRRVRDGLLAAGALFLLGWGGFLALGAVAPGLAAEIEQLYAWRELVPDWLALLLLALLIVPGEEIVWRGAVTLPLAGRFGPWWGCLLGAAAFSAAHLAFGFNLLLIAAFGAGFFWGWLAIRTRSLAAPIVCHLAWDIAVIFGQPY